MGWEIWRKVRRFLLFWTVVFLVLLVAAVLVYRRELAAALQSEFSALIVSLTVMWILIGVIVWMIREAFS